VLSVLCDSCGFNDEQRVYFSDAGTKSDCQTICVEIVLLLASIDRPLLANFVFRPIVIRAAVLAKLSVKRVGTSITEEVRKTSLFIAFYF